MKYLLDTNVFREIGKTVQHEHVGTWLKLVDDVDLAISTLTVREIKKGIVRLRTTKPKIAGEIETRVVAAFDAFDERILPVSRQVAELWGELLAGSEKHIDDTGMAATARIHRLTLVTRNVEHFRGRGVAVLDPYRASPQIRQV